MNIVKLGKDYLIKQFWGKSIVPRGLFELGEYFRQFGPIKFSFENKDGLIIAVSQNYRHGSIITSGKNDNELEKNIKDAILTSFEVPSAYKKEAKITRVGKESEEYALA
jgi:hypothetical protein